MINALTISQTQAALCLGRTKVYQLINAGELPAKKLGKRTVILRSDLEEFLLQLETYPVKGGLA